ncbi:MAG: dephospho-CoA kinase [Armatimonadaceae bacterium]
MKVFAITGGIGTGKSAVARMFATHGAQIASADEDARAVLEPGSPTLAAVQKAFPEAFSSEGTLQRATLGGIIFQNPEARQTLNALMHPAIRQRMRMVIDAARHTEGPGVLLYEVPLLYEGGLETWFDGVIVAYAPPEVQADRLQERERTAGRPLLTPQQLQDRLQSQMPVEEKARRADYVIRTDSPFTETEAQVRALWENWQNQGWVAHASQA